MGKPSIKSQVIALASVHRTPDGYADRDAIAAALGLQKWLVRQYLTRAGFSRPATATVLSRVNALASVHLTPDGLPDCVTIAATLGQRKSQVRQYLRLLGHPVVDVYARRRAATAARHAPRKQQILDLIPKIPPDAKSHQLWLAAQLGINHGALRRLLDRFGLTVRNPYYRRPGQAAPKPRQPKSPKTRAAKPARQRKPRQEPIEAVKCEATELAERLARVRALRAKYRDEIPPDVFARTFPV